MAIKNKWKKIVIKVGTSTIVKKDGNINLPVINQLVQALTALSDQGREIIFVTSGAIGLALHQLGLKKRPKSIPEQQALAAIGQANLMAIYNQNFSFYHQITGQVLLTYDVFSNPVMKQNMLNALGELLKKKAIPIINENDVIAVDEMDHQHSFGDNDHLAALVTVEINADALIILSDVNGLYDKNPHLFSDAKTIKRIDNVDDSVMQLASGKSLLGKGGMRTKLSAAEYLIQHNKQMLLLSGEDPQNIFKSNQWRIDRNFICS
ncbi:gamma-glutamyl kinase [Oenococcus alcoholitolerans]|uniref:Glutamate 5-kinase n=1 Tax=Oenococcus alcoholitolerans TaxID=931074 RepID=A0ABR4XQA3_9LACO|nr:gamma-glutamyl kinase [Oenococcus alcoholitolerans]